jgi:hypothetical protein
MNWTFEIDPERPGMSWWERQYDEKWDYRRLLAEAIEIWLLTVDVQ